MSINVNTNFTLSGEKEYREKIGLINQGIKVLNAEMKLSKTQFEENADSIDALTAKNDILERTISTQEDKIKTLREVLQKSAEAYGESDKKTMGWQESLYKAEAELNNLNSELRRNSEEIESRISAESEMSDAAIETAEGLDKETASLENQSDALKSTAEDNVSLGDAINSVADKLGIKLPSGATKAISALGSVSATTVAAASAVAAYIAILVKLEKAFIDVTIEAAAAADEMLTMSSISGMSVETLQEMQYAAEFVDVSVDRLNDGFKDLTSAMKSANTGSEDAQKAFAQLGVNITDSNGKLRNAKDVFFETIDALGQLEAGTQRDALAMTIFSESARELNPLIDAGSGKLRQLAQQAHDTGYVLSEAAVKSLGKVDDALKELNNTQEGLKNQLAAEFAPTTEKALNTINDAVLEIGNAFVDSGVVDSFADMLESSLGIIDPLTTLAKIVLPWVNEGLSETADMVALIADTADVIIGLLTFDFDKAKTALGWNPNEYSNTQRRLAKRRGYKYDRETGSYYDPDQLTQSQIDRAYQQALQDGSAVGMTYDLWLEQYKRKYWGSNASGTDNWRGGWTRVGENGPENVYLPRGAAVDTAQESRDGGNNYYYITIDAKSVQEFEDIVRIAQEQRWKSRMG
nr:MAG TPA: tail tape measure [Caudoviricetes sp.]